MPPVNKNATQRVKRSVRLDTDVAESLAEYARLYYKGNETTAINAILRNATHATHAENGSNHSVVGVVATMPPKSVCVGDKLTVAWKLKPNITVKVNGEPWVLFPDERVLAVKVKSANGNNSWFEVVEHWELEQWQLYCPDQPASDRQWEETVNNLILSEQVKKHPIIAEAIAKGFTVEIQGGDVGYYVGRAEKYLAKQALLTATQVTTQEPPIDISPNPITEVLSTEQLAQRCCPEQPTKKLEAMAKTLKEVNLDKLQKGWTSRYDPDGLVWLPDETRTNWVCQQKMPAEEKVIQLA